MKKSLLILLCLPIIGFGQTSIPNANFEQALIALGYDSILDGSVITAHIDAVTYLDVSSQGIADLTGIEDFTALTDLHCYSNQLTSLDVSANTALTLLFCGDNALDTLDISANTALTYLFCNVNQLTSLDVSTNTALTNLVCGNNQLTNLDVSNNDSLIWLDCSYNDTTLTSLDVRNGNNMNLSYFNSNGNPYLSCISVDDAAWSTANWTNIDTASSFAITCSPQQGYTYTPDNNFEQALINLGYDTFIDDYVYTDSINTVANLNVAYQGIADLTGIEDFTDLDTLSCSYNSLNSFDISNNTALTWLACSYNDSLTNLDISNNTDLLHLYCNDNELTSLNIASNTDLITLRCEYNQLTSLDVTTNTDLITLYCSNNEITTLDVNNNVDLEYFSCSNNELTSLDVNNNTALVGLNCFANYITCLDISNNTDLTDLYCGSNLLEQLNTKNGNWSNMSVSASSNNLSCAEVENVGFAANNWSFDAFTSLTLNCGYINPCATVGDGCTDPTACNYDPLAIIDDGSCIYPPVTSMILGNTQTNFLSIEQYSVTQNIGSTFHWNINPFNAGNIINGQTTNSIETQWGTTSGDFTLCVIETDINGCVGDEKCLLINVVNLTNIEEYNGQNNLLKITDILGKETPYRRNTLLFYIYDDGTVEKRVIID